MIPIEKVEVSKNKKWYKRIFNGDMFFALLVSELFEEVLEEAIATGITWVIGKMVSVLLVVTLTQGTKIIIKRIIKSITYKEGNDKMEKIKKFCVGFKKKVTENIVWSNKLTITSIASATCMFLDGANIVDITSVLPKLLVGGFDIMPCLVYIILALLSILGISGTGFEKTKNYLSRIADKNVVKTKKHEEKETKKAIEKKTKELELKARENIETQAKALVEAERANNQ